MIFIIASRSGYNKWRWAETPSEILQKLCSRHGLAAPVMVGRRLQVGGKTFTDSTKLSMGNIYFTNIILLFLLFRYCMFVQSHSDKINYFSI